MTWIFLGVIVGYCIGIAQNHIMSKRAERQWKKLSLQEKQFFSLAGSKKANVWRIK